MNLNYSSNLKNRDSKKEKRIFNKIRKTKRANLFSKKPSRNIQR